MHRLPITTTAAVATRTIENRAFVSEPAGFSPAAPFSVVKTLILLAAVGCSMLLTGCYVYTEDQSYDYPRAYYGGYPGYYAGDPYYYYGGVPYYYGSGRYYYYRNHERCYVRRLPHGGNYVHDSAPRRDAHAWSPQNVHASAPYQPPHNVQPSAPAVRYSKAQPVSNPPAAPAADGQQKSYGKGKGRTDE